MNRLLFAAVTAIALMGANTAAIAVKLPGTAALEKTPALQQMATTTYPAKIPAAFPAAILSRVSVAAIPVYLPRTLPKSAPAFTRVSAAKGVYRLELTFKPSCDALAHYCHYATFLSQTTITPPADATPMTYKGVAMFYHKPVCAAYCTDGGLYFQEAGVWHAIEARGQLSVLEQLYDSSAKVQ
jgi:hypothetical protein